MRKKKHAPCTCQNDKDCRAEQADSSCRTGEHYGWGRVLDYIGVEWEERYVDWGKRQMSIFDFPEVTP